jgi:hypothetical protein
VAKHFAQLLYVVHCGVPLVGAVLRNFIMADDGRRRTTKLPCGRADVAASQNDERLRFRGVILFYLSVVTVADTRLSGV